MCNSHLQSSELSNHIAVIFGYLLFIFLASARRIAPDEFHDFLVADISYPHAVEHEVQQTNLNTME